MGIEEKLKTICNRTRQLISEIKAIQGKEDPNNEDLEILCQLKTELKRLSPKDRFLWIDAVPVVDIFDELKSEGIQNE